MTAVDHAELKRVAERCTHGDPWYKEGDLCGRQTFEQFIPQDRAFIAAANPAVVLALLSEIEGLKAERDEGAVAGTEPTPEQIEPFARQWCISNGIDPDEPTPPHGEWPRWYDEAGPFAAMWKTISAHLRTQAPDSWRPDREEVDAAIRADDEEFGGMSDYRRRILTDAILALRPQTSESGE